MGFRLLLGAVTLLLVSSVNLGMKLSKLRRKRGLSGGARLFNYLEYLSRESSQGEEPPLS